MNLCAEAPLQAACIVQQAHRFTEVDTNADILQHLLLYSVGALELEHSVLREDMLDNHNVVLCLLLRELHRCAALEKLPILGELWYLQCTCTVTALRETCGMSCLSVLVQQA